MRYKLQFHPICQDVYTDDSFIDNLPFDGAKFQIEDGYFKKPTYIKFDSIEEFNSFIESAKCVIVNGTITLFTKKGYDKYQAVLNNFTIIPSYKEEKIIVKRGNRKPYLNIIK